MGTELTAQQEFALYIGIILMIVGWVISRYLVMSRPLSFWDNMTVITMGMVTGQGIAKLYYQPMSFFVTSPWMTVVGNLLTIAILLSMLLLIVRAIRFLFTRRL